MTDKSVAAGVPVFTGDMFSQGGREGMGTPERASERIQFVKDDKM